MAAHMPIMRVKGVELQMQVLRIDESGVMTQRITAESTETRYKLPNAVTTLGLADICGLTGFREIRRSVKTSRKNGLVSSITFSVGTHTTTERRAAFLGAMSSSLRILKR